MTTGPSYPPLNQLDVGGLTITFRQAGVGRPIVFLHGFFGDSRVWRQQFDLARDYTVVAWDAPGCGRSSPPPDQFEIADYAVCLGEFIDGLDLDRPHLVGNSFGGALALAYCDGHADKVASLTLVGAYAGWSGSLPPDVVEARLEQGLADLARPPHEVASKWLPGFITDGCPPNLAEEVSQITEEFSPAGMRSMIRALAEADLRSVLARVRVPTLLVWGAQDARSSVQIGEAMHRQIPGSRFLVIEGAGHLVQVEAAQQFDAAVRRFLESNPG